MQPTYRLEFNEKQQYFHLDSYTHQPNTFGWFTISENCSELEFQIFEAYVNRAKIKKLTKEYLLKSSIELNAFQANLREYNLAIGKS